MPWDFALIFLALAILLPAKGFLRMRKLLARPRVSSLERISLYASTMIFQWTTVAIVAWRAWARGLTAADLGLAANVTSRVLLAGVTGAILFGALQWLNLRRMGRLPLSSRGVMQNIAERILPQSDLEKLVFFALAATAGLCEEFLFRGFVIAVLFRLGWPAFAVVLCSAILFGLGHIYQGPAGVASSSFLGALFGAVKIHYGSLVPVILCHFVVDLVAGLVGARFLIGKDLHSSI